MLKYMKEFILPLYRKGPSLLRSKPNLVVSFQKTEPEDTFQDEKSSHSNCNIRNEFEGANQQEVSLNTLAESILAPLKVLIPGIKHPEHLSNLADFRIQEETLYDSQFRNDDALDLKSKCYEQPRSLFHSELVPENLSEESDPVLKQNIEMNKILNQMMTTRRLRIKEYENRKRQEKAREKMNIVTVVKNKGKQRCENNINDSSKPDSQDSGVLELFNQKPKGKQVDVEMNQKLTDPLKSKTSILEEYWGKRQPNPTDTIDISTIIELENRKRSVFYRTEPTPQAKTITSSWEAQERLKKFIVSSKIDNIPKDLTTSNLSLKDYGGKEFKRSLNPMKTPEKDIDESKTKQSGSRNKTGEDA